MVSAQARLIQIIMHSLNFLRISYSRDTKLELYSGSLLTYVTFFISHDRKIGQL